MSALWCPLATPTILLGFLLPWAWGIFSLLLQQSTAADPYLGRGTSPYHHPSWPSTWDSSSRPSYARAATAPWVALSGHHPWPRGMPVASGMGWLLRATTPLNLNKIVCLIHIPHFFFLFWMLNGSVLFNSLWHHGLYPARLLCSWNFPGKKSGAGCHFHLQGIFLDAVIKPMSPMSPALQMDSLPIETLGSTIWLIFPS